MTGENQPDPGIANEDVPVRVPVVLDMETQDPDDFLCLLFLAGHPRVDLRAVVLTPGTPEQVGLIRWALERCGRFGVDVGGNSGDFRKPCVSSWHYEAFGRIPPAAASCMALEALARHADGSTTLVVAGPIRNASEAARRKQLRAGRAIIMGGFAGEGLVPPDLIPSRWRGLMSLPSFNLGGSPTALESILRCDGIRRRLFVSKNVTHRVVYDRSLHSLLEPLRGRSVALQMIWQGMDRYLGSGHAAKKLHDLVAAACVLDEDVCCFVEVELFWEKRAGAGCWGSRPATGTGTWISVDYDHDRFIHLFTECRG